MLRVTDLTDAREAVTSGSGSPRITSKDRVLLLEMLEGDGLATVFQQIVAEDFGPEASSDVPVEDSAHDGRDPDPGPFNSDFI